MQKENKKTKVNNAEIKNAKKDFKTKTNAKYKKLISILSLILILLPFIYLNIFKNINPKQKLEKTNIKTIFKIENKKSENTVVINANKNEFLIENIVTEVDSNEAVPNVTEDGVGNIPPSLSGGVAKGASFLVSAIVWIIRVIILLVIDITVNVIGLLLTYSGGDTQILTIESVLFNKIPLLNPAIWEIPGLKFENFYESISGLINIVIVLAIGIQLFSLLIAAIKGIMRTVSLKTYVTKNQLDTDISKIITDWIMGVLILFGVVFYAGLVIGINNKIVDILHQSIKFNDGKDLTEALYKDIFSLNVMKGTISFLMFVMIKIQAIALFFKYMQRFIKLMFLLVISPLIASSYAIDRIRDGKSQLLSSWNKMFVQTVLMQIIHVVIYVTTISVLINPGNDTFSLAGLLISILGVNFIWTAEQIIYDLFKMDKGETGSLLGSTKLASTLIWSGATKKAISVGIGAGKKGSSLIAKTAPGKAAKSKVDGIRANINEKTLSVRDKITNSKVGKAVSSVNTKAKNIKKSIENNIDELKMIPTETSIKIKEKAYNIAGLKAPTKRYDEERKTKKRNIKLKRQEKTKAKIEKKKTRKKRRIKKATTFAASAGVFAVTLSTREIELSDLLQSRLKGGIIAGAIEENIKDKETKPRKIDKKLKKKSDIKKHKKYENMYNEYKRYGENVLTEGQKNSFAERRKKDEAFSNYNKTIKMKEALSGSTFDVNTPQGKRNLERYDKIFSTLSPGETAEMLEKNTKKYRDKVSTFLETKKGKDKKEIETVLKQIESLVKAGITIKSDPKNKEMNNYVQALINQRYFIDREQYEMGMENLKGDYKKDVIDRYISQKTEDKDLKNTSDTEYLTDNFDIDKYYTI